MSNPKHYIDNEKFFKEMKKWKQRIIDARQVEDPDPVCTDYIAECFLKISEHLAWKPNFINYTFRDDLVSDGIENCLLYAHNLIQKNHIIHSLILHKLFIMRLFVESRKRKNRCILNINL